MAGVYIKGKEMPKSCDECYIRGKDTCPLTKTNVTGWGRPLNCPLVPVPPHGRLIDADALINALQELFDRRNKDAEYTGFRGAVVSWNDAICYIKDAPTIIQEDATEERSYPTWIPVTERLPEDCTPVQVCYIGYYSKKIASGMLACRYDGLWCYWDGEPCSYDPCRVEITHWQPLPEPPKED